MIYLLQTTICSHQVLFYSFCLLVCVKNYFIIDIFEASEILGHSLSCVVLLLLLVRNTCNLGQDPSRSVHVDSVQN